MRLKSILLIAIIGFFSFSADLYSQNKVDSLQIVSWHGFQAENFHFSGREARIVKPESPREDNPWVWRARFPDWHIEMDSILLHKGFHIVFLNTDNLYGSPEAMNLWDNFYEYLTEDRKFSQKVALEGVSRGGLFIYNWAKKNPGKVSCIYGEAPVCDFKSWPLGKGKYKGSTKDWKQLMEAYDFKSTEEALTWKNNPVDNLEALAEAKVPVLHMIGLNDIIVPPDENTFLLVDNYIKLGGIATIYPNTRGEQNPAGHHFKIDDVQYGVNFIVQNTSFEKAPLKSDDYHVMRNGLQNSINYFQHHNKANVAFLGGSITYNPGWRDSIYHYLVNRFPETNFEFIAAGIPSMGSTPDAFRLERDVLSKGNIDLLFVDCAVNDRGNGRTSKERIRATEGIVRHALRTNPSMDIVFLYFVDPGKMEDYRCGNVPAEIQDYEKVAQLYSIPTVNLAKEVSMRIDAGEFTWKDDFKDLHPSPFGQGVYYRSIKTFFENACKTPAELSDIDAEQILPEKLDDFCYDMGTLVSINESKPGKGWGIIANWEPEDRAGTRAGYVNVPMLVAESPGAELLLKFEGRAIGITVAAGPDAGIIEYRIDKLPWKKLDIFTKWSEQLHLPWYYVLNAELPDGKHRLRIRISEEKNEKSKGNACRISHFFVNEL